RYTNPVNAWQHEVAYGWYDQGGLLPPGASVVYNGTGQSETVLNSRQLRSLTAGGTLRIEVAGPEEMRRLIRRIVRVDGHGNVQEAFG
ncbi:MAG: hypothetical protein ACRDMV_18140, partial [Streptosporangiales bacterium]